MMATTFGFIICGEDCQSALRNLSFKWNRQWSHKSLGMKFFNVFTHGPVIEANLFGDVEDRVLAFKAHHDLFDSAGERPALALIYPETVTTEKNGTTEGTLRDVIAGVDADNLFSNLRRADEHVLVHNVEIVVGGVILVVWETIERDARHIDTRSVDHAFIVGGRGGEVTLIVISVA